MEYPFNILPNENYKLITCDISNLTLIRFFSCVDESNIINSNTGKIFEKYIADPTKHISDYSLNLLGVFELKDIFIELTASGKVKYSRYCSPNQNVSIPIFEEHFIINKSRKFFTLKISELTKIGCIKLDGKGIEANFVLMHTPMEWNFWHYSLRWRTNEGKFLHEQDEKLFKKSGWVRQLSSLARAALVHFASIEDPNFYLIDKSCYIKN